MSTKFYLVPREDCVDELYTFLLRQKIFILEPVKPLFKFAAKISGREEMTGTKSSTSNEPLKSYSTQSLFLLTGVSIVLTFLVYGRTIWLPFFFDDLVQLPFVDRYTFVEHWAGSNESPYYRPLVISIWKIFAILFDTHSPQLQHGLNLIFHALNGLLIAILGMQLQRFEPTVNAPKKHFAESSILFGLSVLILYLIFPFHHQAIPWPGALFHIFVTTLILGALIAYLNNRMALALALGFFAPFAHENGVVIPVLIFCIELVRFFNQKHDWQKLFIFPALMSVPTIAWLILRSFVTAERDSQSLFPGIESIWQSLTWFFQGLTWPATIFGRFFPSQLTLNDLSQVWLLGAIAIVISAFLCWRSKDRLILLLFGSCWWLIASAPAMLVLPFGYIVNSPRLLSFAGCGVAIFWAVILIQLFERLINRSVTHKLVGGTLLLTLCAAQYFAIDQIREANAYHTMLGDVYQQAVDIAEELDDVQQYPVFVNFPSSAAPRQKTFVLGNEGVIFWPGYAPLHTIVTTNGPIETIDQQFVQADRIRSDQPYLYGIVRPNTMLETVQQDPDAVFYNTIYKPDSISLVRIGNAIAPTLDDRLGYFSSESGQFEITLADWEVDCETVADIPQYRIKINWVIANSIEPAENITVFVHAVSKSGELLEQSDGDLMAGLIPFASIPLEKGVTDIRYISANPEISAFRLGLYNRVTGERIPFFDLTGQRTADDMFVDDGLK